MHHLVGDEWSFNILVREFAAMYRAFEEGQSSPLPSRDTRYADFCLWQKRWLESEEAAKELSYWGDNLADAPTMLDLPTDYPRPPTPSYSGGVRLRGVPIEIGNTLRALASTERATMFMVTLSVFVALLSRYSGQTDIIIGVPIANRPRREFENVVGFFVNTIALRIDASGNPSFRDLVRRTRDVALGAYVHQKLPFPMLVKSLKPQRDVSRNPIFQAMFTYQPEMSLRNAYMANLEVTPFRLTRTSAHFDMSLGVVEDESGSLCAYAEYASDLFDEGTADRMLDHYVQTLEEAGRLPDRPFVHASLVSAPERRELLYGWNSTQRDYDLSSTVASVFEKRTNESPRAIAVRDGTQRCTYAELDTRAGRLAAYLHARGVGPEDKVAVCLPRSVDMLVTILGVLKSGAAFVPLDSMWPSARLAFILADSSPVLVIAESRLLSQLPDTEVPVLLLDSERVDRDETMNSMSFPCEPANLAYVIYTSGSTGNPKGVMVENLSLVNYLYAAQEVYELGRGDRMLHIASLAFDWSLEETLLPLSSGASVAIAREEARFSSAALLREASLMGATVLDLPVAALEELIAASIPGDIPASVRLVITGGDRVPAGLAQRWRSLSATRLLSGYGPTECTVQATLVELSITESNRPPPIGRPMPNARIYIIDDRLEPVPMGFPGEICIAGPGVARGYLNNAAMTAEKFLSDPFVNDREARMYRTGDIGRYRPDGNIEFLGRADRQVKFRGYRVELGEIEAALMKLDDVGQAAVLLQTTAVGNSLVGYVGTETSPSVVDVRRRLAQQLPDYMVPSRIVLLPRLPRTTSGKIDYERLPMVEEEAVKSVDQVGAPQTRAEAYLVALWKELLTLPSVERVDNFFDLGGHSLLAMAMIGRIRGDLRIELSVRDLFDATSLADLAARLDEMAPTDLQA